MSRVFSAKRKIAEFDYEFLDGTKVELKARSLSTKEQVELDKEVKKIEAGESDIEATKKAIAMFLSINEKRVVNKVIKEQYEEGDIRDFFVALNELIAKEKGKKSQG